MRFPTGNKAGIAFTDPNAPRRPYVPRPCACGCGLMGLRLQVQVEHLEQRWAKGYKLREAERAAMSPAERHAQAQRDIADLFPE